MNSNYQIPSRDHRVDYNPVRPSVYKGGKNYDRLGPDAPLPHRDSQPNGYPKLQPRDITSQVIPFTKQAPYQYSNNMVDAYSYSRPNIEGTDFNDSRNIVINSLGGPPTSGFGNSENRSPASNPSIPDKMQYRGGEKGVDTDKERFFESLGLPRNLSRTSLQNFSYLPRGDEVSDNSRSNYQADTNPNQAQTQGQSSRQELIPATAPGHPMEFKSQFAQRQARQNVPTKPPSHQGQVQQQIPVLAANYPTTANFKPTASYSTDNNLNSHARSNGDRDYDMFGDPGLSIINPTSSAILSQHMSQYNKVQSNEQPGGVINGTNSGQIQKYYQTAQFSGFGSVERPAQGKEVMTITIEIGDGQNENILIHEKDSPRDLAKKFAIKYGIGEQLTGLLAEQIRLNIEQTAASARRQESKENQKVHFQDTSSNPNYQLQHSNRGLESNTEALPSGMITQNHPLAYDEKMDEVMSLFSQDNLKNKESRQNNPISVGHGAPLPSRNMITEPKQTNLYGGQQSTYEPPMTFDSNYPDQNRPMNNNMQIHETHNLSNYDNLRSTFGASTENESYANYTSKQVTSYQATNVGTNRHQPINPLQSDQRNGIIDPTSQSYLDWYRSVNNKLTLNNQTTVGAGDKFKPKPNHSREQMQEKPKISNNSRQIVEQKRFCGSNGSGAFNNGNVHDRLHQAAVAKQKASRDYDRESNGNQDDPPRGRGVSTGSNIMRRSNSNLMPKGQYKMMLDQQKREGPVGMRSSSAQGKPMLGRRYNSTTKHNASDTMSGNGDRYNYGELLYRRGMKRKDEMRKMVQRARSEQDRLELAEYSFQPQINQISKNMRRVDGERPEDFLLNYGKAVKEKLDSQRIENLRKETEGLSFKPKVSRVSERIMEQKELGSRYSKNKYAKFDSLYQDAKRRQERQDFIYSACIESECTFQPDTEKTKFFMAKGASMRSSLSSQVFDRLSQRGLCASSKERSRMCIENSNSLSNDLFDPDTGQALFHPRVGRGPRGQARAKDPGVQLYNEAKKTQERKESRERRYQQEAKKQAIRPHSSKGTNKIAQKGKQQSFTGIFARLDSDGDGKISAYRIDISSLEPELLQVLSPLFVEMEELGMTLDEEEFVDAASRLYDSVSLPEKNILTNRRNRSQSNSARAHSSNGTDQMFRPKLNPTSVKIAERRNCIPGTANVADRLHLKGQEYDSRIMEKRSERQSSELLGCTFHPKILQQSPRLMSARSTQGSGSVRASLGKSEQVNGGNQAYAQEFGYGNRVGVQNQLDVNGLAQQVVNEVFNGFKGQRTGPIPPPSSYLLPVQHPQSKVTQTANSSAQSSSEAKSKRPPPHPMAQAQFQRLLNGNSTEVNRDILNNCANLNIPMAQFPNEIKNSSHMLIKNYAMNTGPNGSGQSTHPASQGIECMLTNPHSRMSSQGYGTHNNLAYIVNQINKANEEERCAPSKPPPALKTAPSQELNTQQSLSDNPTQGGVSQSQISTNQTQDDIAADQHITQTQPSVYNQYGLPMQQNNSSQSGLNIQLDGLEGPSQESNQPQILLHWREVDSGQSDSFQGNNANMPLQQLHQGSFQQYLQQQQRK